MGATMRTPKETAEHMIEKYGTKQAAVDMSICFMMSYDKGDAGFKYWDDVKTEIKSHVTSI